MEKETQKNIVLRHLQDGKTITALEALYLCGSLRLSSIIYNLRDEGYDIRTEMVDRCGKRVAEYSLLTQTKRNESK